MNRVFFTADTHFGHRRMAEIRGFESVEAMDAMLVECWNDKVRPDDLVYHLGDFTFSGRERAEELFAVLHGRKHLVAGNHDAKMVRRLPWESVMDLRTVRWCDRKLFLCHYPTVTWPGAHGGVWHLHGHSHGMLRAPLTTRVDVGVDTSPDLGPWEFGELVELFDGREYLVVDHHGSEGVAERPIPADRLDYS